MKEVYINCEKCVFLTSGFVFPSCNRRLLIRHYISELRGFRTVATFFFFMRKCSFFGLPRVGHQADRSVSGRFNQAEDEYRSSVEVENSLSLRSNMNNSIVEPDNHLIKSWNVMEKEQWGSGYYSQQIMHSVCLMDRFLRKIINFSIFDRSRKMCMQKIIYFFFFSI